VVKNSEIFCAQCKQAVFIAAGGVHAKIDRLVMYNLCAENIAAMVSDPDNIIGQVETNNVLMNNCA
jgi:hypothetical protein